MDTRNRIPHHAGRVEAPAPEEPGQALFVFWWKCWKCGHRLGRVIGDRIEVKYSGLLFTVWGRVSRPCERCGTVNVLEAA